MDKFNKYLIICAFTLIVFITIGYAYLNTTLTINGTSKINNPTWNIHFENVQVKTGSVTASTPTINPNTTVTYSVNLSKPGDFFEFTVDAKNDGSIDAMIDTVVSKLNNTAISNLPSYLNYYVSYSDGVPLAGKQQLNAGAKETIRIRVDYKKDLTSSDLPSTDQSLNFSFTITYIQKDSTAISVSHPESFSTDSWETIVGAVKIGNTSMYNVGDTKTINMGSLGTHTLRIANKSTPAECSQSEFSQTACGFVLEFADVILIKEMNSTDTNIGGWPATTMRTYVNSTIYNALPEALRNGILNTTVVSGHGSTTGETNFTSTDKLYLLATHEVWTDSDGNPSEGIDYYNTEYNYTRQLDYYYNLGVTTTTNYSRAIKKLNSSNYYWWLRSIFIISDSNFEVVLATGKENSSPGAANLNGVSPAFRIG